MELLEHQDQQDNVGNQVLLDHLVQLVLEVVMEKEVQLAHREAEVNLDNEVNLD